MNLLFFCSCLYIFTFFWLFRFSTFILWLSSHLLFLHFILYFYVYFSGYFFYNFFRVFIYFLNFFWNFCLQLIFCLSFLFFAGLFLFNINFFCFFFRFVLSFFIWFFFAFFSTFNIETSLVARVRVNWYKFHAFSGIYINIVQVLSKIYNVINSTIVRKS